MVERAAPHASSGAPDALDCDFGWNVGVLFRAYLAVAGPVAVEVPGGMRGFQVLAAAVQGLDGGQSGIANRLGLDKTVLTYLIDDLEAAGLVSRQPNPADRRHKRIVATELGRARWQATQDELVHAEDHLLEELDSVERAAFRQLLRRVAAASRPYYPPDIPRQIVTELESLGGGPDLTRRV